MVSERSAEKSENNKGKAEPQKNFINVSVKTLEKALKFDIRGETKNKLLIFFMALGALRKSYQVVILTGGTLWIRARLLKSILHLFPKKYVYINSENRSKKALLYKAWKDEKILFLTNFEKNRDIISKFIEDEWTFSVVLRNKNSPSGHYTKDITIPKFTVISSTEVENIKLEDQKGALIVELMNSREQSKERSEYFSYISGNYSIVMRRDRLKELYISTIRGLIECLNFGIVVEVPYEEIIRKYFRHEIERNVLYHHLFLELIKNITFFHQYKRNRYIINKNGQIVILSSFEDLKLAFQFGGNVFSRISQNLKPRHIEFLNYIMKWLMEQHSQEYNSTWFTRSSPIYDFIEFLKKQGRIPRSTRTYQNYFDLFVRVHILKQRKEHGLNWYQLNIIPSLKEPDLEKDEIIVNKLVNKRIKELQNDPQITLIQFKN